MRVSAVQFKADKTDKPGSLERLSALAREAARESDLVVLPEMAVTGYVYPTPEAVSAVAEVPEGQTFCAMREVALAHGCWVVVGFPERSADRLFNSALVIDPRGVLRFTYRKTLLFDTDLSWATPGDSGYRVFTTDVGTFGVGICMDLNDDRFVRWCADTDVDAIAFPTNWLEQGVPVHAYWFWRLQHVRGALVAANSYGVDGDIVFCGRSAVMSRTQLHAQAPPTGDGVIAARITVR